MATALLVLGAVAAPHSARAGSFTGVAVPAYFSPATSATDWSNITAWGPSSANHGPVKIAVMVGGYNGPPSNAPTATTCTYVTDTSYVNQVTACHTAGIQVYGYVHCMAGCRPYNANTAWNGLHDNGVYADIDNWFNVYHVDGIFLDEGPGVGTWSGSLPAFHPWGSPAGTMVNPVASNGQTYYGNVYNRIWLNHHGAVILNPGGPTDEGYVNVANIICVMENTYSNYMTNSWVNGLFQPGGALRWVYNYPVSRFWHIVNGLDAGNAIEVDNCANLAITRHAGYIYCTDHSYGTLPTYPASVWGENIWDAGHY